MRRERQLKQYYEQRYAEHDRLGRREGQLELARTQELLGRFLPPAQAKVIDIGGGTGIYAAWLAAQGYDVDLVDIVAAHVQGAAQAGTFRAVVGDACALPVPNRHFDVALLLGPLYHLLTAHDRQVALQEACRVVKPGGLVVAAFISRGAVLMDGYVKGWIDKPGVIHAMREHMEQGASPTYAMGFGAIAYFHLPGEARAELVSAGLDVITMFGVEGPGWIAPDFETRWQQAAARRTILESAELCEEEPALQGLSPHLLAFARPA